MVVAVLVLVPQNVANVRMDGRVLRVKSRIALTNVAEMESVHQALMENVTVNQVGMVPTVVVGTSA